jgi:hypothetical protein
MIAYEGMPLEGKDTGYRTGCDNIEWEFSGP